MTDYLPDHIKEIKIDFDDLDVFFEKIKNMSDMDQTWMIKRLVKELDDARREYKKTRDYVKEAGFNIINEKDGVRLTDDPRLD
jgi:hypothetical protein